MRTMHVDKLPRILKMKKQVEEELHVKITNKRTEISIQGKTENEFLAEEVIEALDFGFEFRIAMLIKEDDFVFEKISIKSFTKRKDLNIVRGRIIGKEGRTKKALSVLTKCFFELKNNEVGIIGDSELIKNAQEAVILLIKGTKQANVYKYLEKHQPEPILDLGLKDFKKKSKQ